MTASPMVFHLIAMPHTATSRRYLACAYTQKVVNLANMLTSLGHTVHLYGAKENEAHVTTLTVCTTPWAPEKYATVSFEPTHEPWKSFNRKVIGEIKARIGPRDFVLIIGGKAQGPVVDAFKKNLCVEWGIGYSGTLAGTHKVFESYAWMHACAAQRKDAGQAEIAFYDTVIPNSFNVKLFHEPPTKKGDYFLFLGRVIGRKGVQIAEETCKALGRRLIIAGPPGDYTPTYGEVVGSVGVEERAKLFAEAGATFVPTTYLGPFEGVAVESLISGTPVITTDFGAFTDYVENGFNGFRCSLLQDFIDAAKSVHRLNTRQSQVKIAREARSRFDVEVVKYQYERYFRRLLTLFGDGWYSRELDREGPVGSQHRDDPSQQQREAAEQALGEARAALAK